jgi:hypothetical protein
VKPRTCDKQEVERKKRSRAFQFFGTFHDWAGYEPGGTTKSLPLPLIPCNSCGLFNASRCRALTWLFPELALRIFGDLAPKGFLLFEMFMVGSETVSPATVFMVCLVLSKLLLL